MATDELVTSISERRIAKAVDDQLAKATVAGRARASKGDLAIGVRYDARAKRLSIELASGIGLSIPVEKIQGLEGASSAVLGSVRVEGGGYGLHWPSLDLDVAVPDLVAGCFGPRAWMSALGRQGGAATTESKRIAARENGRKGGRPRKDKAPAQKVETFFRERARRAEPDHARSILKKVASAPPVAGDELKAAHKMKEPRATYRVDQVPMTAGRTKVRAKKR